MTPDFPAFLRISDPLPNLHGDHQRHPYKDFPLEIDQGFGPEPLTIDLALPMFERMAEDVLG